MPGDAPQPTPRREARGDPSGWGGTCGYCGWSGMPPQQVSCGRCGLWSGTEYVVSPAAPQTTAQDARTREAAAALVRWLDDNGTILQDEMEIMVPVPAMLLRDLRKAAP